MTQILHSIKSKILSTNTQPLVSVIIPCYNYGRYLHKAIESVLAQTYIHYEIIVVDDGSTDNSRDVAKKYGMVTYIFQSNAGLAAARNKGIENSNGQFIVFLDADDWLCPTALEINSAKISNNNKIAFVSGASQKVNKANEVLDQTCSIVDSDHYKNMLEGNYIGMIATIMFQRWIFDFFTYDTSLKVCEDYDLYLKICKIHPVIHHQQIIAVYFIHDTNMSCNVPLMLDRVLFILNNQKLRSLDQSENDSLHNGKQIWKDYYCNEIYKEFLSKPFETLPYRKSKLKTLALNNAPLFLKVSTALSKRFIKNKYNNILSSTKKAPLLNQIKMGDFDRIEPFSKEFGYDRGGPVDRYYIENFLKKNNHFIKGRVLEVGDNDYTLRFGGNKIERSEILHVDASNADATYVGDLSDAPMLTDDTFDCIILTQTLHLIYNHHKALATCYRILKQGGTLILTVPGITQIDQGEWHENWLWSFTGTVIKRMLEETFYKNNITVNTHGNVLAATAFLFGMGAPELKQTQLDYHDLHYQVIITAIAIK